MKIIHLIWAFNVGGAESMLVDILNEQSKTEKVHLMIVNQLESRALVDTISKNVKIHRISRKPGSRNILNLLHCNLKILKLRPDVIHCHSHDLIQFIPLARQATRKLFLTIHNTGYKTHNFSKYNRLFSISKAVQKDVYNRAGLMSVTVCNGIKTELIKERADYAYENFRMVQVGRLYHKQKGQDIVMHALAHLVHSKNIKNVSMDFIGSGNSEAYLRDLAKKLKVTDHCNFVGLKQREWIYDHLCKYDLLVQPSRFEGFGLTVAEAMAAKVPVLVSDIEGPMEIIDNGKYGYSFIGENSQDLAQKILSIQEEYGSSDFYDKITNGYVHIVQLYDIKQTASNYLKEY